MAALSGSKTESKAMRGTDDQFDTIVNALQQNAKGYESKTIKYIQYLDTIDKVFSGAYGWGKKEFYEELNRRLGIQTNDSRREEKKKRKEAQTQKSKKK